MYTYLLNYFLIDVTELLRVVNNTRINIILIWDSCLTFEFPMVFLSYCKRIKDHDRVKCTNYFLPCVNTAMFKICERKRLISSCLTLLTWKSPKFNCVYFITSLIMLIFRISIKSISVPTLYGIYNGGRPYNWQK